MTDQFTSIEMSEIKRSSEFGRIVVPSGWIARIPRIRLASSQVESLYLSHLQKQGIGGERARGELEERIQEVFNRGWTPGLREMIANRAEEFVRIHGPEADLLRDFRPEALQRYYFPGDNVGRKGKPGVRRELIEMGGSND